MNDAIVTTSGFWQAPLQSPLFGVMQAGRLVTIVAKIVDDLLHSGALPTDAIIFAISAQGELATIIHGRRHLSLNPHQYENYANSVDGDDKRDGI